MTKYREGRLLLEMHIQDKDVSLLRIEVMYDMLKTLPRCMISLQKIRIDDKKETFCLKVVFFAQIFRSEEN